MRALLIGLFLFKEIALAKRYYWLKLQKDFFKSRAMKKLRKLAGGDTYTIIYLKLQLMSLKDNGHLYSEFIDDDLIEELSLEIDEDVENVKFTLIFLAKCNLAEIEEHNIYLPQVLESTGSESDSAARVRKHREKQSLLQSNENVTLEKRREELDIDKEKIREETTLESLWGKYLIIVDEIGASKSNSSLKALKTRLNNLSNGDEMKSKFLLYRAIEGKWKTFYPLSEEDLKDINRISKLELKKQENLNNLTSDEILDVMPWNKNKEK